MYLFNKALIVRPNTTYRSSIVVFCYTLQLASDVQISYHQVGVGYTKNINGERPLFTVLRNTIILLLKGNNKVKTNTKSLHEIP